MAQTTIPALPTFSQNYERVLRIDKEIKKELFEMFLNCLYSWYPREGSTGNGPQGLTE